METPQLSAAPAAKKLAGGRPVARQEDNATSHSAKKARACARSQFATVLSWPAQSPGLSPLGYSINSYVKSEIAKRASDPAPPADVRAAILSAMEEMPRGYVDRAIGHFPKRLRARVAQGGAQFEHTLTKTPANE